MNTNFQNLAHAAQRKMAEAIVDTALTQVSKDREASFLKIVDIAETFYGNAISKEKYNEVRAAIRDPENRWVKFINRVLVKPTPMLPKRRS